MRTPNQHRPWTTEMEVAYPQSERAIFKSTRPGVDMRSPATRLEWAAERGSMAMSLRAVGSAFVRRLWGSPGGRKFLRLKVPHRFLHGARTGEAATVLLHEAVLDVVCDRQARSASGSRSRLAARVRSELFLTVSRRIARGQLVAGKGDCRACLDWFAAHRPSDDTLDFVLAMDAADHQAAAAWGPSGKGSAPAKVPDYEAFDGA